MMIDVGDDVDLDDVDGFTLCRRSMAASTVTARQPCCSSIGSMAVVFSPMNLRLRELRVKALTTHLHYAGPVFSCYQQLGVGVASAGSRGCGACKKGVGPQLPEDLL